MRGILNIIKYITLLIYLSGLVLFIYEFIKCDKKKIFTFNNILIAIILLYFSVIVMQMHIEHYDNFSHWAIIVKNMLQTDMLPNFESSLIMFKSYPPATACFIYFVCKIVGNQETVMMLGQVLITISASVAIMGFVNDKMKNKWVYFGMVLLVLTTLGNLYIGIVPYNELLVDVILTLVGGAATLILFYYKNDLKKMLILNCVFALFLILIKNSGMFFVLINGILTIYLIFKNSLVKNKKNIVKIIVVLIMVPLLTLLIWKQHVKYVYGEDAENSKHSMSISYYIHNFSDKSLAEIYEITKNYVKNVFNTNDISLKLFFVMNIIMLLYIVYYLISKNKAKMKENIVFIAIIDVIYMIYLIMLYGMYLFSMESGEAASIGGFSRYAFTVSSYLFLLFICKIITDIQKNKDNKILILSLIFIIIFNIVNIVQNPNKHFLIGKDNYQTGDRRKFDEIIKDIEVESNSNFIVYAPKFDFSSGYLYFMGKYLLDTNSIYFVKSIENINLSQYDYLIIYDEDKNAKNILEKYDIKYEGIGIYELL